ncbi:MAG: aldose 1-epimerase [Saprospiraceae bacterium]|nr:aldose 1-epimerase [Lewinella sp.]
MYQHQITPFGKYEKHTLLSPDGQNRLELVPGHGACVLDLVFDGVSVLDGYRTAQEMESNRWSKNIVLFPFPNRLKEGRYEWEGTSYQFPINDAHTGNALHGFGAAKPMRVNQLDLSPEGATIGCEYRDAGEHPGYPFPFTFNIQFAIDQRNQLTVTMAFQNDGTQAIPVGLGWHPYFRLSDKADTLQLLLPECELIGIDRFMIPNGKRYNYDKFTQGSLIGGHTLDNCFALPTDRVEASAYLEGEFGNLRYWQETGKNKFNFLQVFTPPHRESVALEPMTCNIDGFNNGDGLIRLDALESFDAKFGLKYMR